MSRKKPPRPPNSETDHRALPAQQDQSDILDQVGATHDTETGGLLVDEDRMREIGAVDTDAVRENERTQDYLNQRRGGVKGIAFNTDDPLQKYELILREWPANTIDIYMRRLTGTAVQHTILSRPRSGAELYEAVKLRHGASPEAEYELKFVDTNRKSWRGMAKITMPDTQPAPQQGQPMLHYPPPPGYPPQGYPPGYAPPGYAPPPGYTPQGYPPPSAPTPQQNAQPVQQAPAPSPPVFVQPTSQAPDMNTMLGVFEKFLEMSRSMQPPAPPPVAQTPAAPQPPMYLPPPPPATDPGAQLEWMNQAFAIFQRMQPQPQPQVQPAPAAAPQPSPAPSPMGIFPPPPIPAPPGMVWMPPFGFIPADRLAAVMQAISGVPPTPSGPPERAPYRPRPPYPPGGYMPQDEPPTGYEAYEGRRPGGYRPSGGYRPPPGQGAPGYSGYAPQGYPPSGYGPPPPQGRAPLDDINDAVRTVQTAAASVQKLAAIFPGMAGVSGFGGQSYDSAQQAPETPEDDSPIQVVEAGPAKIVVSKQDGTLRGFETMFANLPGAMKWMGEQAELIRKSARQQEQPQQPQRLPEGYVEVGPGYRPPAGFVAVPVEDRLPPPPVHVPPPIRQGQQPAWGAPPSWNEPGQEEG